MSEKSLPTVDQPRKKRNIKDRIPVNDSTRNVLSIAHREPGYKYRWVINDPDRVTKFEDAWWEVDQDSRNLKPGDRRIDTSAGTSSVVETKAGGGRKYVLMRIPEELWQDDQKAKHKRVDEIEAEMLREAKKEGRYGKIEIEENRPGSTHVHI